MRYMWIQNTKSYACAVFVLCCLLLPAGCAQVAADSSASITPAMLSAQEKLLHGMPLDEREISFAYSTSCKTVRMRVERYADGKAVESAETAVKVEAGEGSIHVIPQPEGNVIFCLHETKPVKHNDGFAADRSHLAVHVENKGLASSFQASMPDGKIDATKRSEIILAVVTTDVSPSTQLYDAAVYADRNKLAGYEEAVVFSCVFE